MEIPISIVTVKPLKGKKALSNIKMSPGNNSFKRALNTRSPIIMFKTNNTPWQKNKQRLINAAIKIQRWYRKIIYKKKKYPNSPYKKVRHIRVRSADIRIRKQPMKAHEYLIIKKIILAAKNNTANYLLKKQHNGQLKPFYINYKDNKGNSALYYAVANNSLECVRILLRNGGNPNLKCEYGNTPLHMGFKKDHIGIIGLLLSQGGNPEAPNDLNETPLFFAIPKTADSYGLRKGLIFNCE